VTGATDSAGVPWEGRSFPETAPSSDDGSPDPRLTEAVAAFRSGELAFPQLIVALHEVRLLVPLIAVRGDEGVGAHGQLVDKTQELSIVTVEGPDGRAVLPAFSGVESMRRWNPDARPIPIQAPRVAIAAASEGTELIAIDPASENGFVLRRPAFRALALGEEWIPSYADAEVRSVLRRAIEAEPAVSDLDTVAGDPEARLAGPELQIRLAVAPGLDAAALEELVARLATRWAAEAIVAERVDSLGVGIRPAS
tara:strand:- start:6008 stop:6766 length:759 start_codon:yes stop_codon:yes gene_type:complete